MIKSLEKNSHWKDVHMTSHTQSAPLWEWNEGIHCIDAVSALQVHTRILVFTNGMPMVDPQAALLCTCVVVCKGSVGWIPSFFLFCIYIFYTKMIQYNRVEPLPQHKNQTKTDSLIILSDTNMILWSTPMNHRDVMTCTNRRHVTQKINIPVK